MSLPVISAAIIASIGAVDVIAAAESHDQPPANSAAASDHQPPLEPPEEATSRAFAEITSASPNHRSFDRADFMMLVLAIVALALVLATRWHRLHRTPKQPLAFTAPTALFLLGTIFLLGPIGMSLAALVFRIKVPEGDAATSVALDDMWKLQCGAMTARMLGVVAYFMMVRAARPPLPDRRAKPVVGIALGFAALLLTWPMVTSAVECVCWLTSAADAPIAHETLRRLVSEPLTFWGWMMIVGVTIIGPLTEEVMYRGLLQNGIRRAGATPWAAIAITSTIFAVAHMNVVPPHGLVGLFVLSLGFGWAFERSGTLCAPFTMHALFNAGNILLASGQTGITL